MTYLTKEDWETLFVQKLCDDKSFSEYIQEKNKIQSDFIFLLQKILKTKNNYPKKIFRRILFSSLIIFHKFILANNITFFNLSFTEKLTIYLACIFLSFKIINKLIPVQKLSSEFQYLFNDKNKMKYEIEDINKLITNKEFEILFSIQFQINLDWPYDYLNLIENYLGQIGIGKEIIKAIINFVIIKINEIILFPLYLYYTPFELIISSLTIIKEEFKLNYIDINEFIKINKLEIVKENISKCSFLINKIIKFKKKFHENEVNENEIANKNKEKGKINFNTLSSIQTNN